MSSSPQGTRRHEFRLWLLRGLVAEAAAGDGRADARLRRLAREVLAELPPERLLRVARRALAEYRNMSLAEGE